MIVSGIPNKNYSQGMKIGDMWEEVFRRFGKENSAMNARLILKRARTHITTDGADN